MLLVFLSPPPWESVQQERACFEMEGVVLDALAYVVEVQRPIVDPFVIVGGQADEQELLSPLLDKSCQAAGHCRVRGCHALQVSHGVPSVSVPPVM